MDASFKQKAKVWLRSRSSEFVRDYFGAGGAGGAGGRAVYDWNGTPVHYRRGTSDARLLYQILLRGNKSEYALPRDARLDPSSIETVLDIGANIGISALFFARLFPRATVHAFEPEPGNCEVLRANAATAGGRIVVHPFALGAEDGELRLFDSDDAANFGGFSAHAAGVNPARSKIVPVRHAGRALEGLGVRKAEVIKIDTEGSEWEILTALERRLLESASLILGELHGRRDFELLAWLQAGFDIGLRKAIRSRLFNFYAVRKAGAPEPASSADFAPATEAAR